MRTCWDRPGGTWNPGEHVGMYFVPFPARQSCTQDPPHPQTQGPSLVRTWGCQLPAERFAFIIWVHRTAFSESLSVCVCLV